MDIVERIISLSVGTKGAEDYFTTYQDMSELARNLGVSHDYVTVNAFVPSDEDETDNAADSEGLVYGENTLVKTREAIANAVSSLTPDQITDIISELQNAGLFLRERR